jgi:putative hemolysin
MEIEIGITCLLLLALTFLATVDMALGHLSDVGLRRLISETEDSPGSPASVFLKQILEDRPRFRFTLSAVMQILLVAVTVLITAVLLHWFVQEVLIAVSLITGLVVAGIFRLFIPRIITLRDPESTLVRLLPFVRPVYRVLTVVSHPWHRSFDRFRRKDTSAAGAEDEPDENMEDLQALIEVGEAEGILEEEEGELIHSIIEFGDTRVSEVMTPRMEIVAVPITSTVRQARDQFIEAKHSRVPVYSEQIDNIEGIIYVRDLLVCWSEGNEDGPIRPLVRPVYEVPETKPVAELLKEMQKSHFQLAIVIDEHGGIAGLVTTEDILEEIVGEIEDEDTKSEEIVGVAEGSDHYYEVAGSTDIGKVERLFGLEIEDEDFTTIAGLVISELGRVPRKGERFAFRGLDVEVLDADDRRINRLRLRRATSEAMAVKR